MQHLSLDSIEKNNSIVTDMINGAAYSYEKDTYNLILFADAANYTKSGNKSFWAIFSSIVELPPLLRDSYENIIFHSMWSGSNPEFNIFLEKYNEEIDEVVIFDLKFKFLLLNLNIFISNHFIQILKEGIYIKSLNKKLKIRIHGFTGDTPARDKATNKKGFNGKFGCLNCLHPTEYKDNKTIYPFITKIKLRTNTNYIQHLTEAEKTKNCYKGIKGFNYLILKSDHLIYFFFLKFLA